MFLLHANTILDPDSHAPESGRPSIRIRDIDPTRVCQYSCWLLSTRCVRHLRFNGHALTDLQGVLARLTGRVVDVETDVVAQVMGEEGFECLDKHTLLALIVLLNATVE